MLDRVFKYASVLKSLDPNLVWSFNLYCYLALSWHKTSVYFADQKLFLMTLAKWKIILHSPLIFNGIIDDPYVQPQKWRRYQKYIQSFWSVQNRESFRFQNIPENVFYTMGNSQQNSTSHFEIKKKSFREELYIPWLLQKTG